MSLALKSSMSQSFILEGVLLRFCEVRQDYDCIFCPAQHSGKIGIQ